MSNHPQKSGSLCSGMSGSLYPGIGGSLYPGILNDEGEDFTANVQTKLILQIYENPSYASIYRQICQTRVERNLR
jgi:hypothetical protein